MTARDTAVKVGIGAADVAIKRGANGSVVIDLSTHRRPKSEGTQYAPELYEANLLESMSNSGLSSIASELDEGIRADILSRREAVENYNAGLEMLGLRLEDRGVSDKTSKVRHPLLLWAVVKFQANARGEMLPSDGPAKIKDVGDLDPARATHLQERFNWWMTTRATEYYPDTDRALFYIGYGGTIHKKVYRCPRRNRPVSETVYFPDLIISNDTTDVENAVRVTHQITGVTYAQMMQFVDMGYFLDAPIGQPIPDPTSTQRAESAVIGIKPMPQRPQDFSYTLYETTVLMDLSNYGIKERGAPDGVPLPYTVTMDRDSKQLYRLTRAWRKDRPNFVKKKVFFKWGMIPGIGYQDLGFLHLLGNHTRALTALERILIDSGIFSNFPGGVRMAGSRVETNQIMAAPGEFPEIDTGTTDDIRKTIMALPFKGPTMEVLQLLQELQKQGETVAGTIDITTGEGSKEIPVGTMIASIEQQTQVSTGVHKRLHTAQGEELQALKLLLEDQPEELVDPDRPDEAPITAEELRSTELIPVSDPNIPAHVHRIMQAVALDQLQQEHPDVFNEYAVVKRLMDIGRVTDQTSLLIPPEVWALKMKIMNQVMAAQAAAGGGQGSAGPDPAVEQAKIQSNEKIKGLELVANSNRATEEAASREREAGARLASEAAQKDKDRAAEAEAERVRLEAASRDNAARLASQERIAQANVEATAEKADLDASTQTSEAALDRESREDVAAMNDQTQLILKDKEVAGEATEGGEARDKKKGP